MLERGCRVVTKLQYHFCFTLFFVFVEKSTDGIGWTEGDKVEEENNERRREGVQKERGAEGQRPPIPEKVCLFRLSVSPCFLCRCLLFVSVSMT